MKLTEQNKAMIDIQSYEQLLKHWRNAPAGDHWFEGETGDYWSKRMKAKRETADHVGASKKIGWEGVKSL